MSYNVSAPVSHISPAIPELLTVPELAAYLGIGRNQAYALLKSQKIKGFRIGNVWKVSKEAVNLYIKKESGMIV